MIRAFCVAYVVRYGMAGAGFLDGAVFVDLCWCRSGHGRGLVFVVFRVFFV